MRKFIKICYPLFLFLSLSFASPQTDTSDSFPMLPAEKEALYNFLEYIIRNSFNGSSLYPDPCGWTPIQGISCDIFDGFWYITSITIGPIHENSLECSSNAQLSHFLFEFKHIKSLSFFNCFHHPTKIPYQNWEKIALSLESLEFRSNRGIMGEIPSNLGYLTNLVSLVLIENRLMGDLPSSLGNLSKLKRLVLSENQFMGQIPDSFGGLSELLLLDLSRNSLSGPMPLTFGGLVSLLKLDLSSNYLGGKLPIELGNLRNLTLLDLRNNSFTGGLPQSLLNMVSLEEMLLSNNPIGGNLIEIGWKTLENLTILDFSNLGLIGEIPESMVEMRKLRFLALDNNRLSGTISSKFSNLPCLNALHLNGNNLTGQLMFSQDFYVKLGRKFSAWNNPNLCIPAAFGGPIGVKKCENEASVSLSAPYILKSELEGGNSMALNNVSGSSGCDSSIDFWCRLFRWRFFVFSVCMLLAHL